MALIDEVARALSEDDGLGPLAGTDPWSIYVDLMPDEPSNVIAIYPKGDPVRDGVREAAGVAIRVRGVRASETYATLNLVLDILAKQPLDGWIVWADAGLNSEGEEDNRRSIVTSEITCYRLCDQVDIDQFRRVPTALSYRYQKVSTLSGTPVLLVSEAVDRTMYRGALVEQETITVYLKTGTVDRSYALTLHSDRGKVDVDGLMRRGSGCARNVDVLQGARRVLV